MESNNLFVAVAIFAVVFSFAGAFVAYNSFADYNGIFTGFAVEQGVVNVTVSSLASIEIYSAGGELDKKTIDWGSGRVAPGAGNFAILSTNGTVSGSDPSAKWNGVTGGFLIRNIGNTNVSLEIHATPTAAEFIGGSNPSFQYMFSNLEAGSCASWENGVENTYREFLSSASKEKVCNDFQYSESGNEIRLDVMLKIPADSLTGQRSSTVVLTYESI
jgi:hypothetical protein